MSFNTAGVLWYLPGLKRPIAGTPVATSNLIEMLAGESPAATVADVRNSINFDTEAQEVLDHYIRAGYGEDPLSEILANRIPRRKKP